MVNAYTALNQPEPLQAMYVNGVYLEEAIEGYRTLTVEGRETLDADIKTIKLDSRDGARIKRRRIESRTITVNFLLAADTPEEFAEKYNDLKSHLYKIVNSNLIFDDEPDKFFIGTYDSIKVKCPGRSVSTGSIKILCADPFKYSVTETTVTPQTVEGQKVLIANYQGTVPAHPVLCGSATSDCGFYGFVHDNGAMLQAGDPEEVDTEPIDNSEYLLNASFNSGVPSGWTTNNGTVVVGTNAQTGSFGLGNSNTKKGGKGIDPSVTGGSYGSGAVWHGPSVNYVLPADSNSEYGSKHFRFTWQETFVAYAVKETGMAQVNIIGKRANNTKYVLAGMEFVARDTASHNSVYRLWVNGEMVKEVKTTVRHDNPQTGTQTGERIITKKGDTIYFRYGDGAKEVAKFTSDEYEDLEALEITLYGAIYGSTSKIQQNTFYSCAFRKDKVAGELDLRNSFFPGAQLEMDTSSGTITVNGTEEPDIGAIGNMWEEFVLEPGVNTIICASSDWAEGVTYSMRYREAWL